MFKIAMLLLVLSSYLSANLSEKNSTKKKSDLAEKAIFSNKKHYDQYLERNMKKEKMKKKKDLKIYKRKDGSIDTLKTINEANN